MNNAFQKYGEALRVIRRKRGWSQRAWGERVQISPISISWYEREESILDLLTLGKLLAAAEVSLAEFDLILKRVREEAYVPAALDPDLAARIASAEGLSPSEQRILNALARIVLEQAAK